MNKYNHRHFEQNKVRINFDKPFYVHNIVITNKIKAIV